MAKVSKSGKITAVKEGVTYITATTANGLYTAKCKVTVSKIIYAKKVTLSETSLTPSEQDALAWRFAELKGKQLVQGTWEELAEQGFIDKENLYWENGCLLSIHEEGFLTDEEKDPNKITFRAEKWRSGLGAIMFTDCTAERNKTGHWSEYTPGGFAIA